MRITACTPPLCGCACPILNAVFSPHDASSLEPVEPDVDEENHDEHDKCDGPVLAVHFLRKRMGVVSTDSRPQTKHTRQTGTHKATSRDSRPVCASTTSGCPGRDKHQRFPTADPPRCASAGVRDPRSRAKKHKVPTQARHCLKFSERGREHNRPTHTWRFTYFASL